MGAPWAQISSDMGPTLAVWGSPKDAYLFIKRERSILMSIGPISRKHRYVGDWTGNQYSFELHTFWAWILSNQTGFYEI